jgi:hypothetical protein
VHAPDWLGPAFSKRAGTGLAVAFQGSENVVLGMDDFEFVSPVAHGSARPSQASAEKGRELLDILANDLAAFVQAVKALPVEVRCREYRDRVR